MSKLKVVVIILLILQKISALEWAYNGANGQLNWQSISPTCGGRSQSPINIYESIVIPDAINESFDFSKYKQLRSGIMTNTGNGVTVDIIGTADTISKGGLPAGEYRPVKFHFHWGRDSSTGAEHLINTFQYPMEMQIVHINTKYRTLEEAANKPDGIAVLAFYFHEMRHVANYYFFPVTDNLKTIVNTGENTTIPSINLKRLLPWDLSEFYRYKGSLTTPPCIESVIWTVFAEVIHVSTQQVQEFRLLKDSTGNHKGNNYRSVQQLNSRTIQASFQPEISWTYDVYPINAGNWTKYYPDCGRSGQSPINISLEQSIPGSIANITFLNYNILFRGDYRLHNNGMTVQLLFNNPAIGLRLFGITALYQIKEVNFHWGNSDKYGSEHRLNGRSYPMEIQIMHYSTDPRVQEDPDVNYKNIVGVVVLVEVTIRENFKLRDLFSGISRMARTNEDTFITSFSMSSLVLETNPHLFVYDGSVTTPPCTQTVRWLVMKQVLKISHFQLQSFRNLKAKHTDYYGRIPSLVNNFRAVQPLNNRTVHRNF